MPIKGKRKKIMLAEYADNANSEPQSDLVDYENVAPKKHTKKEKNEKKPKRKITAVSPDDEQTRDDNESAVQADATATENEIKPKMKKNKKKKVAEKEVSVEEPAVANSDVDGSPVATNDVKQTTDTEAEENKENIQQEHVATLGEKKSTVKRKEKTVAKQSRVKKLPSGLVVEKLVIGDPKAKRASHGKKVGVRFIGKLKSNDKIFDSNIGSRTPLQFRLGLGKVIKGWDVGINGMGVGDKRRLTIPPALGYGSKGCAPAVPRNAWLVFDVELVSVR